MEFLNKFDKILPFRTIEFSYPQTMEFTWIATEFQQCGSRILCNLWWNSREIH